MDDRLKQRLVGAVVLVVAAVVFVPMLFDSRDEVSASHGHTVVSPVPSTSPSPPTPDVDTHDADARVIPLDENARASGAPQAPAPAAAEPAVTASSSSASASTQTAQKSGFAVQLGSFSKTANARGLRDRLVAKGYTAYMVTTDSVTRVYVGPQSNRAQAERMREKLLADTKLEGIVVEHSG